jgi:hypothetical protein
MRLLISVPIMPSKGAPIALVQTLPDGKILLLIWYKAD